ncbi:MAG: SDR family NAD(P)-dependent oxidoreductase [Pseudomonadota bacterium]
MAATDQVPTQSGFQPKSTGDDVLDGMDLTGKTVIVTGGYSGIGLEAVRSLARKGASVLVPVRSPDKAKDSLSGIDGDVTTAPMDLADLGSVRGFADSVIENHGRVDMLINNAGIMASPIARVGPGWE